jgi:ABC-type lipoprotein export system ATPase subunit
LDVLNYAIPALGEAYRTVTVGGTALTGLSGRALTRLRRERIGFVFQSFNLLDTAAATRRKSDRAAE